MADSKSIKTWSEEDRPREKLLLKGKNALSDAELLAIILGSGSKSKTAVELGREILNSVNYDLNQLAKMSIKDLCKFNGVGPAKAISIISAIELSRRRPEIGMEGKITIKSSQDAYNLMKSKLKDAPYEQFWVICLNRANTVISKHQISDGGRESTLADSKRIFKMALEELASGIILIHNHPSGQLKPSQADIKLTTKLSAAGKVLDIAILDHLIFTDSGYYSFADESIMP